KLLSKVLDVEGTHPFEALAFTTKYYARFQKNSIGPFFGNNHRICKFNWKDIFPMHTPLKEASAIKIEYFNRFDEWGNFLKCIHNTELHKIAEINKFDVNFAKISLNEFYDEFLQNRFAVYKKCLAIQDSFNRAKFAKKVVS